VPEEVGAELDLVAIFCEAWGYGHDSSVAYEDVELRQEGEDLPGAGLDGG
jgi:hypothetical protein